MLSDWEQEVSYPRERIGRFIDILIVNQTKIKKIGCPLETLSTELAKLDQTERNDANDIFPLYARWLKVQFRQLNRMVDADCLAG